MWRQIRRCAGAFRPSPRRCCPRLPASCATWPRSAATSCRRRAAPISATRTTSRATSAGRAPAARRCTGSIATTRSSAGPTTASPPAPPTSRWRWRRSTPSSSCAGPRESARSRSTISIASPATRRSALALIVSVALPPAAVRKAKIAATVPSAYSTASRPRPASSRGTGVIRKFFRSLPRHVRFGGSPAAAARRRAKTLAASARDRQNRFPER
jgi:hypothetical protein